MEPSSPQTRAGHKEDESEIAGQCLGELRYHMATGPTEMGWGLCEHLSFMPEWEALGLRGQNKSEGERHRQV